MECNEHERLEQIHIERRTETSKVSPEENLEEFQKRYLTESQARDNLKDHDAEHGCQHPSRQYLPVRCELHGWLLLDPESVSSDDPVIECEGHMIGKNVRGIALIGTSEYLPKTRGLTDAEFEALKLRAVRTAVVSELPSTLRPATVL
jgi:hypothetical protein